MAPSEDNSCVLPKPPETWPPPVIPHIESYEQLYNGRSINTCSGQRKFAVTLDDGPKNGVDLDLVLAEFAAVGIPVTFFVTPGLANQDGCQAMLRAMDQGHEIQCHTMHHQNMIEQTKEEIHAEMEMAQAWVDACVGDDSVQMTQFRPPYGSLNQIRRLVIEEEIGMDLVLWNVDTFDWRSGCSPDGYIWGNLEGNKRNIREAAQKFVDVGDSIILLMHDHLYRSGTAQWLKEYFGDQHGYEFVTMSDCCNAGDGVDCVHPQGYTVWA